MEMSFNGHAYFGRFPTETNMNTVSEVYGHYLKETKPNKLYSKFQKIQIIYS